MKIKLRPSMVYSGNLILVNQRNGLHDLPKKPELTAVLEEFPMMKMQTEAAVQLKKLLGKVDKAGEIVCVSGFRTREEQTAIFESSLEENGRKFTETYVAFPDHSEHQTGLAMDLAKRQKEIDFIRPEFPKTGVGRTFRQYAAEYGFVERYPAEKEHITGIGAEPWHFRYVGVPHAAIMTEQGMTLEEYIPWLKQNASKGPAFSYRDKDTNKNYKIRYIEMKTGNSKIEAEIEIELPKADDIRISGDNVSGVIITWQEDEHAGE